MSFAYTFLRPLNPKRFADQYREKKLSRLAAQGLGNQVVSKCGVTCVGSSRSGYGSFLNTVDAAGRKLAVVVCYNDFGAAYEAKQKWPDVVTVGMFTDIEMDGFNYANFKTRATLNPWIDYWCIFNEVDGRYSEQADRYITLLPLMRSDGLRLGMFSCASGTPTLACTVGVQAASWRAGAGASTVVTPATSNLLMCPSLCHTVRAGWCVPHPVAGVAAPALSSTLSAGSAPHTQAGPRPS